MVLQLQSIITILIAGVVMVYLDINSAVSALFGGAVSVISSTVFAIIVSSKIGFAASDTIRLALRAEAIKIVLTISLLWAVFKFYVNVNAIVFIGTFILIVLIHGVALLVTDHTNKR